MIPQKLKILGDMIAAKMVWLWLHITLDHLLSMIRRNRRTNCSPLWHKAEV